MKKVLIVIHDMESGGGQKSLLSFLQCMSKSNEIKNYDIDVMVAKPSGVFFSKIPKTVQVIQAPKELLWLGTPFGDKLLKENFSVKGVIGKLCWFTWKKVYRDKKVLNDEQKMWRCWRNLVSTNERKYDIAISYMNGFPNYYVMDKVVAEKKILWIHNEYQKLKYNYEFDAPYYEKCDRIITISQKCEESFVEVFPQYSDKITVLENITVQDDILKKGNEGSCEEYRGYSDLKLLSIGRLDKQKGFDMAIKAAKCLKESEVKFLWLVLGEGCQRKKLQKMIVEYGLTDSFKLLGIRENPYIYIRECDIFVQSSRFEGKSIVLDEAKIFSKPIVVTNYSTVFDSIINEKNGLIVDMNGKEICDAIKKLWSTPELRKKIVDELDKLNKGNEKELKKYIEIML